MKNGISIFNYIVKLYIGNEEQFKKGEEEIIVGYDSRGSFSCYRE